MTAEEAGRLEAEFQVLLPPDYRRLVTDGYPLAEASEQLAANPGDLKDFNRAFREEEQWGFRWEKHFWWIGGDGSGGFYFINTREDTSEVYYVDHEDPANDFDDRDRLFSTNIGNHVSDIVEGQAELQAWSERMTQKVANRRWWQFWLPKEWPPKRKPG